MRAPVRMSAAAALTVALVVMGQGAASAADPDDVAPAQTPPSTSAAPLEGDVPREEIHGGVEAQAPQARASLAAAPEVAMEVVTFSEVTVGTRVHDQYQDRGILFGGSVTFTTYDGANPSSPVLSGSPTFHGDVMGWFVDTAGETRTVDTFTLDVGYIDTPGSVHVVAHGTQGEVLATVPVDAVGIVTVTVDQPGTAFFWVGAVGVESAGFAVDNVTYPAPGPALDVTPATQSVRLGGVAELVVDAPFMNFNDQFRVDVLEGPNAGLAPTLECTACGLFGGTLQYRGDPTAAIGTDVIRIHLDTATLGEVPDGVIGPDERTAVVRVTWTEPIDAVALGDSYSAGEGVGPYLAGTDEDFFTFPWSERNQCHRSYDAYSRQMQPTGYGRPLADVAADGTGSFSFIACSGATTRNVLRSGVRQPGEPATQVGQDLLTDDTDLVVLTIGGNDVGFGPLVTACAMNDCNDPATEQHGLPIKDWADAKLQELPDKLDDALTEITDDAPDATVVLLGYPRLFPASPAEQACSSLVLWTDEMDWFNQSAVELDAVLAAAAQRNDVHYVPVRHAFAGHEICGDEGPWLHGVNLGNPADWFHGTVVSASSFHPTEDGQTLGYTAELNAFFERASRTMQLNPTGLPKNPGGPVVLYRQGAAEAADVPDAAETEAEAGTPDAAAGLGTLGTLHVAPVAGEARAVCLAENLVPAGGRFQVGASGFLPGAEVRVLAEGADPAAQPYELGVLVADEAGVVAGVVRSPAEIGRDATALVRASGAGLEGPHDAIAHVGFAGPCPGAEPDWVVRSASDLHLTNHFATAGEDADVVTEGDFQCTSSVHVRGDVIALGDVHLTNGCRVDGDVHAGGDIRVTSRPSVGGDLRAAGGIRFQSTGSVGGSILAAGAVTVIDGVSVADLVERGIVGGAVAGGQDVAAPVIDPVDEVVYDPTAWGEVSTSTWQQWMNATASANGAPTWSQGLSATPGCTMGPWASSVNGRSVTVAADTVVDARRSTSGCASVSLQQMELTLRGDLVVYADSLRTVNGLRVVSGDGLPHRLVLHVPGAAPACSSSAQVSLSAGTVVDPLIRTDVQAPGRVTLDGPISLTGALVGGCVKASGAVTVARAGA